MIWLTGSMYIAHTRCSLLFHPTPTPHLLHKFLGNPVFADKNRIEKYKYITTLNLSSYLDHLDIHFRQCWCPQGPEWLIINSMTLTKIKPWGQLFRLVSPPGLSNLSDCSCALWPKPLPSQNQCDTLRHTPTHTHTNIWCDVCHYNNIPI